jgi:hypothetical protein
MLPIELTVGQLAALLGWSERQVRYQMDHGGIPHRRKTASPGSHRVVSIDTVRLLFPDAYERLIHAEALTVANGN